MTGGGGVLLALALVTPLAMLLACLWPRARRRMPRFLGLAPVPALAAALLARGSAVVLPRSLLRLGLALDAPGALLLGVAALLWIATGFFASGWRQDGADRGRFAVWWLLTLTGSLGVFVAADLVGFYLLFSMMSLAAYGLVVHDGTARAWRAGAVYVALALLSEAFLLMAFVLLAQASPDGSLRIADAVAALPGSPWRSATLVLLLLGFGLKIGLVPLHLWMPLAYAAAPIPAAAALSGAAVKAGVIGLIRFLPLASASPAWGEALAAAGLASAFYGVAVGVTQANPKTVLAYSSVSQMGVIAAVLGMGLAQGSGDAVALAAAFYAAHHVLVKGGLFLAVGVARLPGGRRPWPVLLPAAVLGLGLAGLPLTGGMLAKVAVKGILGSGVVGLLAALSAAGTTLLMLHFLRRLAASAGREVAANLAPSLVSSWWATAIAAMAVPWAVYPTVAPRIGSGTVAAALAPGALWSALWPMLLGGLLFWALRRRRLPPVPAGDLVAVLAPLAGRFSRAAGDALERVDGALRQWAVAGVSLLAIAVVLGLAMLSGR